MFINLKNVHWQISDHVGVVGVFPTRCSTEGWLVLEVNLLKLSSCAITRDRSTFVCAAGVTVSRNINFLCSETLSSVVLYGHWSTWRLAIYLQSLPSGTLNNAHMSDLISLTFLTWQDFHDLSKWESPFISKCNISWWSTSLVSGPDWWEMPVILPRHRGILTPHCRLWRFSGEGPVETVSSWKLMFSVTKDRAHHRNSLAHSLSLRSGSTLACVFVRVYFQSSQWECTKGFYI